MPMTTAIATIIKDYNSGQVIQGVSYDATLSLVTSQWITTLTLSVDIINRTDPELR